MNELAKHTRIYLCIAHLVLGVLLLSGGFTKIFSIGVVVIGLISIFRSKNDQDQAVFWSAYMVGGEVLFRMSGGMIFHELPKYSVLVFLLLGLYFENKRHHVSISYLVYILLLLIGIAFVDIPFNESIRKAIAFNLSGPILLGISAIYFYNRQFSISKLLDVMFIMGLPIVAMLTLLYFKTPDLKSISFGGSANFETSGGFGPNQVATILGFGCFILVIHLFFKKRFFGFFAVDVLLLMYLVYRGLLTLSRGGMITAFLAIGVFVFFFVLSKRNVLENVIKYVGIIALFLIATWVYTSDATGGMLTNRYQNKNAAGIEKEDVSTGRIELFEGELNMFFDNPFFGVGVGGAKYERYLETDTLAASHNEMSRLLGEHGMIGLVILVLLIFVPTFKNLPQSLLTKALAGAFFVFWFLTINHSAMRIAFPAFIYGLSVAILSTDEEDSIHRE